MMLSASRLMLSTTKPSGSSQRHDMNVAMKTIPLLIRENRPASSRVRQSRSGTHTDFRPNH
jgi:hypothetical protein